MALPSSPDREVRRLRLGLVVDTPALPRWVARAVELTLRSVPAEVHLLVLPDQPGAGTRSRRPILRRMYDKIDARFFRLEIDADTPVMPGQVPGWSPGVIQIPDIAQVESILRSSGMDALLWLAHSPPAKSWAHAARYGIWRWRFGQGGAESPLEASFDTVLTDSPVIEARLTALTSNAGERTLVSSVTNSSRFSTRRTDASATWRAARLLPRAIASVGGQQANESGEGSQPIGPLRAAANNNRLATRLLGLGTRYIRHRLANARRIQQWGLAYYRGGTAESPAIVPGRYTDLLPPKDRDWADPFPVRHDGTDWVFFEEFEYSRGIGHLSVAPLGPQGFAASPTPIVVEDFHLSYPFIFKHNGTFYLMPETALTQRLQLYRATHFPYRWTHDRVLMEGTPVVDPTIVAINGRWWMFSCDYDDPDYTWAELQLHYADSPFGPWTPHEGNPVVTDVRHARPAGRIFQREGVWYRPAQDCSIAYGHALSLCRIDVLNEKAFHETEVARMDPTWAPNLCGVHTLNASEGLTLIDVRRRIWRGG